MGSSSPWPQPQAGPECLIIGCLETLLHRLAGSSGTLSWLTPSLGQTIGAGCRSQQGQWGQGRRNRRDKCLVGQQPQDPTSAWEAASLTLSACFPAHSGQCYTHSWMWSQQAPLPSTRPTHLPIHFHIHGGDNLHEILEHHGSCREKRVREMVTRQDPGGGGHLPGWYLVVQ